MSGRKCSTVAFDSTREQKSQLLNQIEGYQQSAEGIKHQIVEALQNTSRGVQEHFSQEVERAEQWIGRVDTMVTVSQPLSLSSNLSDLSRSTRELEVVVNEGGALQDRLLEAFIKQAGQLREEGARVIFAVESLLSRGEPLIRSWFDAEEVECAQDVLHELHKDLQEDRLGEVSRKANSLLQDLDAKLQESEANESKHKRRLYVLKALRQVCAEMGFDEVNPPQSEIPGDRKSRIILTVDTINRGQVTFYLSLESIEADSCISQNHCFEEFAEVSKQLTDAFGILTKFKMIDAEPPAKLAQKGALDEPESTEGTAEAGS